MRQVINGLRLDGSGKFLDWQGKELAW
jgi:hypothetical protein